MQRVYIMFSCNYFDRTYSSEVVLFYNGKKIRCLSYFVYPKITINC